MSGSSHQEVLSEQTKMPVHKTLEMPHEEDSPSPSNEAMLFHNRAIAGCKQRQKWHLFVSVVFGIFVGACLTFTLVHQKESHVNPGTCSNNCTQTNDTRSAHPTTASQTWDLEGSLEETLHEVDEMACSKPHPVAVNVGEWINGHHPHLGVVLPTIVAVKRCNVDCLYCEEGKRCQVKSGDQYSRKAVKTVLFYETYEYGRIGVTEHLECECGDGKDVADNIELL